MNTIQFLMFLNISLIFFVTNSCGNEPIVGVILLISNSSQYNTTQSVQEVQQILEEVNERSDLLPDIKIELSTVVESKCNYSSAASLYKVFTALSFHDVPTIAILNGGCPSLTSSLADTQELTDLLKLSFSPGTSTTNRQSSITLFPNPLTTISIIASLLQLNGWKRLSLITSVDGIFSTYHRSLVTELEHHDISLIGTFVLLPDCNLDYIFANLSSRIIFLDVYEDIARDILCEAYKRKIYYPYYEWILHGWYSTDWLTDKAVNCSEADLLKTMNRAITIEEYPPIEDMLIPSMNNNTSDKHLPFLPSLVYDTVYTLALALEQSMENDINFTEDCFSDKRECMLHRVILETISFTGKSGVVKFDKNGDRVLQASKLLQYRTEDDRVYKMMFAEAQRQCNSSYYNMILLPNETNATLWPEGIPYDGSPLERIVFVSITAVIPIYILATIGIIFAIACLIFTLLFRNRRIIRLTSPNLNYFIDIGGIILYMSLYIRMLPTGNIVVWNVMCHALVWTNTFGIVLCFSPVLAKVWRVYYIFKNPTSKKTNVKDSYLIAIVLIISITMLVLLVIGTIAPGIRPEAFYTSFLEDPFSENEYGIQINQIGVNCFTTISFSWVIFLSVCVTVIELAALILAIKTRNVKIKALNDFKEITVIVYVTTVGTIEAFIVAVILQGFDALSEGLLSAAFFIITSTILGLVHIPKMVSLYKDPKGESVFDQNQGLTIASQSLGSQPNIYEKAKISVLEKQIATLEQMLQQNGALATIREDDTDTETINEIT